MDSLIPPHMAGRATLGSATSSNGRSTRPPVPILTSACRAQGSLKKSPVLSNGDFVYGVCLLGERTTIRV